MTDETSPPASERTIALIAGALIAGVVVFGAVVAFLNLGGFVAPTWSVTQILSLGAAFGGLVASSVLPGLITRQNLGELRNQGVNLSDPARRGQLLAAYQVQFLVGYALLEGPALFGLTIALTEKTIVGLAAAGFCLVVMIARFPSATRIQDWMQQQSGNAG